MSPTRMTTLAQGGGGVGEPFLVAVIGLEKCCITSAYLQWQFHSGEQAVACGSLVSLLIK